METLNWKFLCEVCQDTIVIPKDKIQGEGTTWLYQNLWPVLFTEVNPQQTFEIGF